MATMQDVLDKLAKVDMDKVGKATDHVYKELDFMLTELQNEYSRLNDWESDFVDSLTDQFEERGNLSEKQINRLRIIYNKHCM